jgi:hypothetical protein
MGAWELVCLGLGTVAVSIWFAWPRRPLSRDASWWSRSSRSYADWKGSWAPATVPLGVVIAVAGLLLALAR